MPATHGKHAVAPAISVNLPAAHCVQLVLPPADEKPRPHGVQLDAPSVFEYEPEKKTTAIVYRNYRAQFKS
jgi:hypothetical protein